MHAKPIPWPITSEREALLRSYFTVDGSAVCWPWQSRRDFRGYGRFQIGRSCLAHRVVYELLRGPIPDGLELDHLCRNPPCVNPDHLEPVAHIVNMRRGREATKTHCAHGHLLEGWNLIQHPNGHRQCRACTYARTRAIRLRTAVVRTTCPNGHPLTDDLAYHPPKAPHRRCCRTCRQVANRAYKRRRALARLTA